MKRFAVACAICTGSDSEELDLSLDIVTAEDKLEAFRAARGNVAMELATRIGNFDDCYELLSSAQYHCGEIVIKEIE